MWRLPSPIVFGVALATVGALTSAHAIYLRGEFESMWGATGTFHFAVGIALLIGLLGSVFFWLGSRRLLASVTGGASFVLGLGVAAVFLGIALLIPASLFGRLWLVPWALLCMLSALAPTLYRWWQAGRAGGR